MSIFERYFSSPKATPTAYVTPPPDERKGSFTIVPEAAAIVKAEMQSLIDAYSLAKGRYVQQRQYLYDMLQNAVDFDSHLNGLIQKRLLSTVGRKLEYVVNGEINEAARLITESPRFDEFKREVIFAKAIVGIGVFELFKKKWNEQFLFDFANIPPKHIDPYEGLVREYQFSSSDKDKPYRNKRNVIHFGGGEDFGLILPIVITAIRKRAAMNAWSEYAALAGKNFQIVKYRGKMPSKSEREQIRSILNAAGTGTADLPPGIDLETNNQTSTSQNDLFEGIVKYYDDQHTKLLLGQTMTTEDGSSRSQAEVHERTQESILDSDAKFLLDVLNYEMFEMLPAFGIAQNGKWQYMESATTKASQSVDLDLKIKELGYNFTPEYIAEKYNLPKPTENVNSTIEQPAV